MLQKMTSPLLKAETFLYQVLEGVFDDFSLKMGIPGLGFQNGRVGGGYGITGWGVLGNNTIGTK